MACNCGRRRVVRQDPNTPMSDINETAESLVANAGDGSEITVENRTDPATGAVTQTTARV